MSTTLDETKKENLNSIIEEVFNAEEIQPAESRKTHLREFITTTVNGDKPIAHLVINSNLGNKLPGILVYILTNLRIIRIAIDKNGVQSNSFTIQSITVIERNHNANEERAQYILSFANGMGYRLTYPATDKKIIDFFQKIDHVRTNK